MGHIDSNSFILHINFYKIINRTQLYGYFLPTGRKFICIGPQLLITCFRRFLSQMIVFDVVPLIRMNKS